MKAPQSPKGGGEAAPTPKKERKGNSQITFIYLALLHANLVRLDSVALITLSNFFSTSTRSYGRTAQGGDGENSTTHKGDIQSNTTQRRRRKVPPPKRRKDSQQHYPKGSEEWEQQDPCTTQKEDWDATPLKAPPKRKRGRTSILLQSMVVRPLFLLGGALRGVAFQSFFWVVLLSARPSLGSCCSHPSPPYGLCCWESFLLFGGAALTLFRT